MITGEVPPKSQIVTEVKLNVGPGKSFYSEINLVSESGNSETVKFMYPVQNLPVGFLKNYIDMRDVPLNLLTKAVPIIQNGKIFFIF